MLNKLKWIGENSIPLIAGVVVALVAANICPDVYRRIVFTAVTGTSMDLHGFINDIFMVFFFASAAIEIVNSMSPGGALNPPKKAITPLMATFGGVIFPIIFFVVLNSIFGSPAYSNGWGIVTATDIALAWLVAKVVFGDKHPAVSFLLLLAVVDDGIGLFIIAIFYPDPIHPVQPAWLLLVLVAILLAFAFNKLNVKLVLPYIFVCGAISWLGMHMAHLHPALALVFIIPFIPRKGDAVAHADEHGTDDAPATSTLHKFEYYLNPVINYGMFFFGFTNAGVGFSNVSNLTWIVMLSLIGGKTVGISLMTFFSEFVLKFPLPIGMKHRDVWVAGIVGGMGLTVALFVTDVAFLDLSLQSAAKMGALFSVAAAPLAFLVAKPAHVDVYNKTPEFMEEFAEMFPSSTKKFHMRHRRGIIETSVGLTPEELEMVKSLKESGLLENVLRAAMANSERSREYLNDFSQDDFSE